jgi:hypothetical protein
MTRRASAKPHPREQIKALNPRKKIKIYMCVSESGTDDPAEVAYR